MKAKLMYWILKLSGFKLTPFAEKNMYLGDIDTPAIIFGNVLIVLSSKFILQSTGEEIFAVVLHEKAHGILKHKSLKLITQEQAYENEFAADAFVKSKGYGRALARVLSRYKGQEEASKYHPPSKERIKRLIGE